MKKLLALALLAVSANTLAQDAAAPATEATAAVGGECAVTINADDAMKFDIDTFTIKKDACAEFTVNLKHVGTLPAAAMGHNVVITKAADVDGVVADGAAAAATNYIKEDDARVLAHTQLVGGGQDTTVTFKTDIFEKGGEYKFFCSFPGHFAIMNGSVVVE